MARKKKLPSVNLKEKFNNFLKNIDVLEGLNHIETESNFFDILDITHTEIRHSNVLAWLLDPNKSKSVGKFVLRKLLLLIMERSKDKFNALDLILDDFDEVEVERECLNTDILVIIKKNGKANYVICIENKVDSKQGKDQLKKYREKLIKAPILKDVVKNNRISFLFLRAKDESPNDENWLEFDYNDIGNILEKALNHCSLSEELALFLKQYLSNLKKYEIMDFAEKQDSAQKIYDDHKEVLDYITTLKKKKQIEGVEFQPIINELRHQNIKKSTKQASNQTNASDLQILSQKIYNRYQNALDYIETTAQSEDAQKFKHYHTWLDSKNYRTPPKRASSRLQFVTDKIYAKVFAGIDTKDIDLIHYCYFEIEKRFMSKIKLVLHKDDTLPPEIQKKLDEVRQILNGDTNEEWKWASAGTEKIDLSGIFDQGDIKDASIDAKLAPKIEAALSKCESSVYDKLDTYSI